MLFGGKKQIRLKESGSNIFAQKWTPDVGGQFTSYGRQYSVIVGANGKAKMAHSEHDPTIIFNEKGGFVLDIRASATLESRIYAETSDKFTVPLKLTYSVTIPTKESAGVLAEHLLKVKKNPDEDSYMPADLASIVIKSLQKPAKDYFSSHTVDELYGLEEKAAKEIDGAGSLEKSHGVKISSTQLKINYASLRFQVLCEYLTLVFEERRPAGFVTLLSESKQKDLQKFAFLMHILNAAGMKKEEGGVGEEEGILMPDINSLRQRYAEFKSGKLEREIVQILHSIESPLAKEVVRQKYAKNPYARFISGMIKLFDAMDHTEKNYNDTIKEFDECVNLSASHQALQATAKYHRGWAYCWQATRNPSDESDGLREKALNDFEAVREKFKVPNRADIKGDRNDSR